MTSRQIGWSQESNLLYEIGKQLDILAKVLANSGKGSLEAYPDLASFPPVGVPGVIYLAEDTGYIYYWDGASYVQFGGGSYVPTSRQLTINGVTFDLSADRTWTISTGDDITVVANYSALPAPNTVTGQFYWCSNPQGTAWLPGSVGGTYYNSGLYYSNGTTWEFLNVPYQATQSEVNAGIISDKFVTPNTLFNSSQWGTKENPLTFSAPLSRSVNTISIPAASSSANGYLSSTDWSTFNGKQGALTLTTTGTSGAATLVGNTLNIPQYSGGGGGMAIGGSITSATAGSVLFAGTSGVLAQDNSNLFWDNTNKRLGIGTVSPQGPFHINSNITAATNGLTITRNAVSLSDANFQITSATNNSGEFLPAFLFTSNFSAPGFTIGGFLSARITNSSTTDIGIILDARTKSASALTQGYILSIRGFTTDYVRIAHNGNMILQNGGTFTDAGFRLDVNGTMRVQSETVLNNFSIGRTSLSPSYPAIWIDNGNRTLLSNYSYSGYLQLQGAYNNEGAHLRLSGKTSISNTANSAILITSGFVIGVYGVDNVGINPNTSAILQANSTTQGFLPPRMTTTQKNAISSPASGLVVYDSTTNKLCCYNGSTWNDLF